MPEPMAAHLAHIIARAHAAAAPHIEATSARVHYRQEAIYVSYLGTAEILGPAA